MVCGNDVSTVFELVQRVRVSSSSNHSPLLPRPQAHHHRLPPPSLPLSRPPSFLRMVPDPPSSPPAGRPSAGTSRKPSFALGGFPPSTPLAVDQQDPFSFRQPQPVETPYANPWQNLFAQSGAPTPSVLPPDSPFAPVNAVGFGFPADGGAGAGGGARRGSLGHPGVASGFSNLSIGSPHRQGTHSHPSLAQSDSQRSMGPPPPMQPPQQWPTSTSPPQLSLPPSKPSFAHPTLNKDANGHMMGGPIGGTGRRAGP